MPDPVNKNEPLKKHILGGWIVNSRELSLVPTTRNHCKQAIELRPKVMQVLICLMARQGQVVTREELIKEVWDGNAYVGENGLTDAIWQLRKRLDEDKNCAPYIQTVPKQGYRLLVSDNLNKLTIPLKRFNLLATVSVLFVAAMLILNGLSSRYQNETPTPPVHSIISKLKGHETYPEISPNGRYLTYTHIGPVNQYRIYLQDLEDENSTGRLLSVAHGLQSGFATWSENDKKIAFVASDLGPLCEIRTFDLISNIEETITQCSIRFTSRISWNSKKNLITFSTKDENSNAGVIALFDSNKKKYRQLTFPTNNSLTIDRDPSFSPSGELIAFTRRIGVGNADVYLTDLQGNLKRLTYWNASLMGFSWTENDNELLVAVMENNKIALNHYTIDTQIKTAISLDGHIGAFPDYHHGSRQLVFSKRSLDYSLVALDIYPKPNTIRVKSLFQSPGTDTYPNYSTAAEQYAFISNRDGNDELWLASKNEKFTKLTDLKTNIYSPAWSPDGRRIAFTAADTKNKFRQLFVIDIADKDIKQLTFEDTDHAPPTWSSDGQSLYAGVAKEGVFYLWQYNLDGDSKQILDTPSIYALEHPTKDTLLFTDMKEGGIYEYDFKKSTSKKIIDSNSSRDGSNWLTTQKGIYYVMRNDDHDAIHFYDVSTQKNRTIMQFPAETISAFQTITLNPQSQEIIFVQRFKQESDIHRVANPQLPD